MPKITTKAKRTFKFRINQTTTLSHMTDRHALIGVSIRNGLDGELHLELMKQLNKTPPKLYTILAAGTLMRWNFWEMIAEISDDELAKRLQDIPKDIDEKTLSVLLADKFADIALKIEKKYIAAVEDYFSQNKKLLSEITFPYQIISWDQRNSCASYDSTAASPDALVESDDFKNKMATTVARFLQTKNAILSSTKERMIKAQPQLSHIDINNLTHHACLQYLLEEFYHCAKLRHTEVMYNGKILPILEPLFNNNENNLIWREFSFKESKKIIEEAKIQKSLARAKSTSYIEDMEKNSIKASLAERRLKSLAPLTIEKSQDNKINAPSLIDAKYSMSFLESCPLSPKSRQRVKTFIELVSKSPPSEKKDLAMKKIEEATALLYTPG